MLDGAFFEYAGDKFVSKQVDNKKKKKLKKVEEKMLGWGMFGFLKFQVDVSEIWLIPNSIFVLA